MAAWLEVFNHLNQSLNCKYAGTCHDKHTQWIKFITGWKLKHNCNCNILSFDCEWPLNKTAVHDFGNEMENIKWRERQSDNQLSGKLPNNWILEP